MDLLVYFGLLSLLLWIIASILYWSIVNGITPTPSSKQVRTLILSNLPVSGDGPVY